MLSQVGSWEVREVCKAYESRPSDFFIWLSKLRVFFKAPTASVHLSVRYSAFTASGPIPLSCPALSQYLSVVGTVRLYLARTGYIITIYSWGLGCCPFKRRASSCLSLRRQHSPTSSQRWGASHRYYQLPPLGIRGDSTILRSTPRTTQALCDSVCLPACLPPQHNITHHTHDPSFPFPFPFPLPLPPFACLSSFPPLVLRPPPPPSSPPRPLATTAVPTKHSNSTSQYHQ